MDQRRINFMIDYKKDVEYIISVLSRTKSSGNKSLYRHSTATVLDIIAGEKEFDFYQAKIWLADHQKMMNYWDYKCCKKIIFKLNDYLLTGEVNEDKYQLHYYDGPFSLLKESDQQLLRRFTTIKEYRDEYAIHYETRVALFYEFLRKNNSSINHLDYEIIIRFHDWCFKEFSLNSAEVVLSNVSTFLTYCYEKGVIDNICFTYLTEPIVMRYFKSFFKIEQNDIVQLQKYNKENCIKRSDFFLKIDGYLELLKSNGYSSKRLTKSIFELNILRLFVSYHNLDINYKIIDIWANNYISTLTTGYKEYRCTAKYYYDFVNETIDLSKTHNNTRRYDTKMPIWAKEICDRYINYRERLGFKYSTICMDRNSILRFILFIDNAGVTNFNGIEIKHVLEFHKLDSHSTLEGKNAYMVRVKNFLKYLYDEGIITRYFDSSLIEGFRLPRKIPNVINSDDINKIVSNKDLFKTPVELRSYAIFMIGLRTGLRGIDIVNLKFENISFQEKTIHIIQIKTNKELLLPLPTQVANAIYNYVKFGRPNVKTDFIFLSTKPPFNNCLRNACRVAVKIIEQKLNITFPEGGFHIVRKSFATNILRNNNSITETAWALGHSDNTTVDDYLNIDDAHMYKCPLSLKFLGAQV